jgi:transposase
MQVCEKCRPYVKELTRKHREEIKELRKEFEQRMGKLERRLAAYENSHTPYSRKLFKPRPKIEGMKRGRPKGLPGKTRRNPKPNRIIESKREACPDCKGELVWLGKDERFIEEIPEPQPVLVTKFVNNIYLCKCCGREVVAMHEDCPQEGRFGFNALAHCTLMKFEDRLTFRKVRDSLKRQYNLEITPASVMDFTRRTSSALEAEHARLIEIIRISECVYADETSIRINGINCWIWIFVAKDAVLCVIRKSRGKKVVKEILADYKGIVVCDGWKAYAQFGYRVQRCWAHAIREAKDVESKKLCELLCDLFSDAKRGKLTKTHAEDRLRRILSRRYKGEKSMKLVRKMHNGFSHWFTFLAYAYVEPTNNTAERALREHVVIRKIIGGLRSEKGARVHEVVMSCLATWKLSGMNLFDTLVRFLRGS